MGIMGNIFFQALTWQFVDVPRVILRGWGNFLSFNLNYFSVPTLLRTFFSHWRRYRYSYGKGFSLKRYFEAFTFNMMSRIIGIIFRTVLVILGLFLEVLTLLVGIVIFVGWLLLPFLLIFLLIFGFRLILF